MGANVSRDIISISEKALTDITSTFAQNSEAKVDNSQEVVISDISGTLDVENIDLSQVVELDLKQAMTSLSENSAQAKLTAKILQESKQVVSGINLAQANYADKNMSKLSEILYNFSNSISQICSASVSQTQKIKILGVKGSLKLDNLLMKQVTGLSSKCVQDATLNNQTLSTIDTDISQLTTQTVTGIDPMMLFGFLGLAVIGIPVLAGGFLLTKLGPILLIAGTATTISSFFLKKLDLEFKLFSGLFSENNVEVYSPKDVSNIFYVNGATPSLEAISKLLKEADFEAFDLDRCNKKVTFYKLKPDFTLSTQQLSVIPKLETDKNNLLNGDLFYDKATGKVTQRCGDKDVLLTTLDKNKTFNYIHPNMVADDRQQKITLNNLVNVSGWKTYSFNNIVLASGIAGIAVGFLLILFNKYSSKPAKPKSLK